MSRHIPLPLAALTAPPRLSGPRLASFHDLIARGKALDAAMGANPALAEVADELGVDPDHGFEASFLSWARAWRETHDGMNFIPPQGDPTDPLDGASLTAEDSIDGHAYEALIELVAALDAVAVPELAA